MTLDDVGVEALQAQLYLCQLASALEIKGNVEWQRGQNLWGNFSEFSFSAWFFDYFYLIFLSSCLVNIVACVFASRGAYCFVRFFFIRLFFVLFVCWFFFVFFVCFFFYCFVSISLPSLHTFFKVCLHGS